MNGGGQRFNLSGKISGEEKTRWEQAGGGTRKGEGKGKKVAM